MSLSAGAGLLLGSLGSGLLSGLGNLASAGLSFSISREMQDRQYALQKMLNAKQFQYNSILSKHQFNYQKILNSNAYNYSKGLMDYEQNLTTAQNQWNALNLPSLNRQGYENAGINPILSINSSAPAQMIGATGVSGGSAGLASTSGGSAGLPSTPQVDVLRGVTDAYRTFALDSQKNKAEIANINANTENTNAKTLTEGYNQKLIEAQKDLNLLQQLKTQKEISWYDKRQLSEIQAMYTNSIANMIGAKAQQMQAVTGRQQLAINDYNSKTDRLNYQLHRDINYKDIQSNRYWNSSTMSGHFKHSLRNAFQVLHGR